MGCKYGAEMMEREGLPLAARKRQRCEEGERFSGAIVSCQGMPNMRGREWLSRAGGCCHKREEVGVEGVGLLRAVVG